MSVSRKMTKSPKEIKINEKICYCTEDIKTEDMKTALQYFFPSKKNFDYPEICLILVSYSNIIDYCFYLQNMYVSIYDMLFNYVHVALKTKIDRSESRDGVVVGSYTCGLSLLSQFNLESVPIL